MDATILALGSLVLVILVALFFLNKSKSNNQKTGEEVEVNQGQVQHPRPLAPRDNNLPRNALRNRLRPRNRPQNRDIEEEPAEEIHNDDDNLNDEENDTGFPEVTDEDREELRKKIGTKKLAKLEEKAARRERNEQMLREREERKEMEEKLYAERKQREQEEERAEKEKEAAEKRAREEQEKRDYEEYLKLKEQFSVEEEGQEADETGLDSESLLNAFVDFIKKSKIVVLEDLAAEFKLKTQDAINRIGQVQEMGLLTGVMDDRGKFIYISNEELQKVKKFIEQRGRVSLSELAKSSNELINLKPTVDESSLVEELEVAS